MFVVRFAVVLVFVVMLLPAGPGVQNGSARHDAQNQGFCDRYPKTCDASGELLEAFKHKLAYGISITRRALEGQPDGAVTSAPLQYDEPLDDQKLDGRYRYSQAPGRQPPVPVRPQGLTREEHSTEWRPRQN